MPKTLSKIPQEKSVEPIFSKILNSPEACARLNDTFFNALNDDAVDINQTPKQFAQILFSAYEQQDISALLLEICQRSMFDLLRESYLIPKRFHGKSGMNPVLLTDVDGNKLANAEYKITHHDYAKFQEAIKDHTLVPRSKLYLADGYDLVRSYTDSLEIQEERTHRKRGILALYALPDTAKLGLSEAEAYAIIWDAFWEIQKCVPRSMVYYGQETGTKHEQTFDEIGILLPTHEFEKQMLKHLQSIDGIVLACREKMMKRAGADSLEL